jgi:ribonucleoside-triphosphate reductase
MQINVKLDKNFTTQFNKLCEEGGEQLRRLNGFAESQLNFTDFIDNFIDKNTVADTTIDGNANVGTKDIVSLTSEMDKPHMKLLAFNKIYYELNKKYGYTVANEWLRNEWDGHFYLHDSASSTQKPYCFAYDIEQLIKKGLYFVEGFNAQPPKHLVTYTDFVGEFVSWTSNRSSGAVGLPSFLIYSFYFWKKDVEEGYYTKSPEYYRDQEFQRIIYKLNQPYLRVNQSAFTNFSIFDDAYLVELFGGKEFPDGSFIIDYIDDIMEYQKAFMRVVSAVREQNAMTFPVLTMALLKKDGKWHNEPFARWCCEHNMRWADSNFYISSSVTALSNCCRLTSDIQELGYFNSIGGTSLEVGSVKVNTINLARIAYENDKDHYLDALADKIILDLQCLDVVRHIIKRNVEKGLLPNYSLEIMHMDSQYNTIGIIGIYEVLQKYGMVEKDEFGYTRYTDEGLEFAKKILAKIHEVKNEFAKDKNYKINVEQVPAERAAVVLMEKDKIAFPNEKYELPLYGNQWIPLAVKTTMQEKVRISAALDKACNGGSIAHINLSAPFANFEQAWDLLNYVADAGVVYFAFCVRISVCKHNHSFYGEVCPICGEPKYTSVQRIVGFLVPERTYSKERKAEFRLRDWMDVLSDEHSAFLN